MRQQSLLQRIQSQSLETMATSKGNSSKVSREERDSQRKHRALRRPVPWGDGVRCDSVSKGH